MGGSRIRFWNQTNLRSNPIESPVHWENWKTSLSLSFLTNRMRLAILTRIPSCYSPVAAVTIEWNNKGEGLSTRAWHMLRSHLDFSLTIVTSEYMGVKKKKFFLKSSVFNLWFLSGYFFLRFLKCICLQETGTSVKSWILLLCDE